MSRYRFRIEFSTGDGEQRRVTFLGDMNGLRWFRREEVLVDGEGVRQRHEQVTAPSFEAQAIGSGSFAGPRDRKSAPRWWPWMCPVLWTPSYTVI